MSTVRDEDPQRLEITLQSAVIGDGAPKEKVLTYTENEVVAPESSGEFVPIYTIPFSWRTHLQVDQSGSIYLGKSDSLRVRILNSDGQQQAIIKNRVRYQPVNPQDIQEHGTEPSNPTYKLIPDHHPAFTEFRVDDIGRPWFNLGNLENDMNTWVVLNNEGLMDLSVALPASFDVKHIRGQNIYGINYSDTGRQTIMVYSISDLN